MSEDNLDRMSKPNKRPLPREWVGLTDEEIRETAKQYALGLAFPYEGQTTPEMFAKAIEAKLKEKNT